MLPRSAILLLLYLTSPFALASLPGALVDPGWLLDNQKGVVVLDIQDRDLFQGRHLKGAVNWPFADWRTDDEAEPPRLLPPLSELTERLGQLGISETTPLVIISAGAGSRDLASAARVYWTMKILGHEEVAIVNGGMNSYVDEDNDEFAAGPAVSRGPVTYTARPNMDLLATSDWIESSSAPRLDSRKLSEYVGLEVEEGERPGTLPGAKHLPYNWLTENGKRLRPPDELKSLFSFAGLPNRGAIHFCHTGHRASLPWFVDYALFGNRDARLYDASMIEWGKDYSLPIQDDLDLPD